MTNDQLLDLLRMRLALLGPAEVEEEKRTEPVVIHPCPEIKDWGAKEFKYFALIVFFGIIMPLAVKLLFF